MNSVEEWLACNDLYQMLRALPQRAASDRKLRLFCCACYRSVGMTGEAVRIAERYADGKIKAVTLRNAATRGHMPTGLTLTEQPLATRMELVLTDAHRASEGAAPLGELIELCDDVRLERRRQFWFLRDIFGNPFSDAITDPSWRTSTAVALARGIYADRAFDRMPILADALQDAGCDNDDILSHCRDVNQIHVRGCWVVDLVLGLS